MPIFTTYYPLVLSLSFSKLLNSKETFGVWCVANFAPLPSS